MKREIKTEHSRPFSGDAFNVSGNNWLREPQRNAHLAVSQHFSESNEPAVLQIPVGCGKTGLMAILPFEICTNRVLIVAPNLTIREAIFETVNSASRKCFWRQYGVSPATPTGPFAAKIDGNDTTLSDCQQSHFVVTNIQQLTASQDKWLKLLPPDFFDMVLLDEGHHNAAPSWQRVIKHFSSAKIVSLTATPFRADGKELTGKKIYRYSFLRAMQRGYIKHLEAIHVAPSELAFTFNDESRRASLEEVLQLREEKWFSRGVSLAPECNQHIVKTSIESCGLLRKADGIKHQVIAVACSVDHATELAALYRKHGYVAETIHSKLTKTVKANILQRLRRGQLDVIVQVQMLGEGFDHPPLSVAAVFRPFRSLPPYIQFVGRVMRVIRSKKRCNNRGVVVSHVGLNIEQYWDDFRDLDSDDKELWAGLASGGRDSSKRKEKKQDTSNTPLVFSPKMLVNWESISELHESRYSNGHSSPDVIKLQDTELRVEGPLYAGPQQRRRESHSRLKSKVHQAIRDLHFQLKLNPMGANLGRQTKMMRHMNNWNTVRYMLYWDLNNSLGRKPKSGKLWSLAEVEQAIDQLPKIKKGLCEKLGPRLSARRYGSNKRSFSGASKGSVRDGWTRRRMEEG